MLSRLLTERPFLLLPPLHRVPLRVGNVVEIAGPPNSAKTHILMQAAVSCILPKEQNGVSYGGLERLVMFFDLDCRFDIFRLRQLLRHQIIEANDISWEQHCVDAGNYIMKDANIPYYEELFASCMSRFLYIRCYDSLEFLSSLKALHYQLQKERERHGAAVHFLMIDSIGAFHWMDRASAALQLGDNNRKMLSLQSVSETVVQEIQKLLLVHPVLVLATKTVNVGDKYSGSEVKMAQKRWFPESVSDSSSRGSSPQKPFYREYMPSVWQSFVTHKVFVRASDDNCKPQAEQLYLANWSLPSLSVVDKFTVGEAGITS